ncbi:hypothetical protein CS022_02870 [Veronia nyctiphanis]|uniref:LamB/YcsF family protein n=1 Tax=Veronia nyctiphanis TaxID=1278244 RepID=A0A4Q0YW99_9GAMM|nr:5-oxoprolinase subunit PxpA [Veronia nyctiphanis]RXJ74534.1 hypothetical protein CS022_02870 [Veronia nyctiphanis]
MKINCDMGESFGCWAKGQDETVMPFIDMASIACGFHASDPVTMANTVALAKDNNVTIGAHPGYPDLLGFGRRNVDCTEQELFSWMGYQIGALQGICRQQNVDVEYVKPHGALYNTMMKNYEVLETVIRAVAAMAPECPLVVMAITERKGVEHLAQQHGVKLMFEAFSDRAYDDKGFLVNRAIPSAVHSNSEQIISQLQQITEYGTVTTTSGHTFHLSADTVCIHGDGQHALDVASSIRRPHAG